MRSVGELEPVDVILRRVDAWYCDPLELKPDSQLGVPGLVEAARARHRLGRQHARLERAREPGADGLPAAPERAPARHAAAAAERADLVVRRGGGPRATCSIISSSLILRPSPARRESARSWAGSCSAERARGAAAANRAPAAGLGRSGGARDGLGADADRRRARAAPQRAARLRGRPQRTPTW